MRRVFLVHGCKDFVWIEVGDAMNRDLDLGHIHGAAEVSAEEVINGRQADRAVSVNRLAMTGQFRVNSIGDAGAGHRTGRAARKAVAAGVIVRLGRLVEVRAHAELVAIGHVNRGVDADEEVAAAR